MWWFVILPTQTLITNHPKKKTVYVRISPNLICLVPARKLINYNAKNYILSIALINFWTFKLIFREWERRSFLADTVQNKQANTPLAFLTFCSARLKDLSQRFPISFRTSLFIQSFLFSYFLVRGFIRCLGWDVCNFLFSLSVAPSLSHAFMPHVITHSSCKCIYTHFLFRRMTFYWNCTTRSFCSRSILPKVIRYYCFI